MNIQEELEILYRDHHYVAINKPAGLLVHPTPIDRHERRFAQKELEQQLGQPVYIIHRLDKPTSGVLLFALSSQAAQKGADAFAVNEVNKSYLAIVRGFPPEKGVIDKPLPAVKDKLSASRLKHPEKLKSARTEYRRLAKVELPVHISRHPTSRYSLLEVHPRTGRMHQIRRHLKHLRYPIVGDSKHGDHKHNRYFREELGCSRLLLAATELVLSHPFTGENMKLTARVDNIFQQILNHMDWMDKVPAEWLPHN